MPISFTLTTDDRVAPPNPTIADEVAGEDVYLQGGEMSVSANGDLVTVVGVPAARQSVVRELPANPGSFPRRREWGGGLSGMIHKNNTPATRDRMKSRAQARLFVNPRIKRVTEVSVLRDPDDDGNSVVFVRGDTIAGSFEENVVVKPPGVR